MKYNAYEVIHLKNNRGLKTRGNFSTTIKLELIDELKELSKETRIPLSKLLDESIEDLINKHKKKPTL